MVDSSDIIGGGNGAGSNGNRSMNTGAAVGGRIWPVPIVADATILSNEQRRKQFENLCQQASDNADKFWADQGKRIHWFHPFQKTSQWQFKKPVNIQWYLGGKTNVAYNCLDRHLPARSDQVAYYWEPDKITDKRPKRKITYQDLYNEVNAMALLMKQNGVVKGSRVTIYMPMVPEAVVAMLACARIGAIHSVVFGGFSADSLADRILDCDSQLVVTADVGHRGGKTIEPLKQVGLALKHLGTKSPVKSVLVVEDIEASAVYFNESVRTKFALDNHCLCISYRDAISALRGQYCEVEQMDSEDPLFLLYTSGSTGKPKGVLHTTAGYLVYASYTHELVFDVRDGDVYWCTADVGWVTGHSYVVYGPLCNGVTSIIHEGVPTYPTHTRHWEMVDSYGVTHYYTAPTAIRSLMREGIDGLKHFSFKSLKLLGSVGEPINPEAWQWYSKNIGKQRCPIVDTWWQTETGGILMSPMPQVHELVPGSAQCPLPGVLPVIVDHDGKSLEGKAEGQLCLAGSWPGQMRTVYKDHSRFENTYFSTYEGLYFTGDGCRRDQDGNYWITGRVDDVLNVAGHRLGSAEIESALVAHEAVAEAAVVGCPHDIKGQGIYAFVTLKSEASQKYDLADLKKELIHWVREEISPIATPDQIQWAATGLPKTRSGKIMRRILRKIVHGEHESLGDMSTLADPSVVQDLILGWQAVNQLKKA